MADTPGQKQLDVLILEAKAKVRHLSKIRDECPEDAVQAKEAWRDAIRLYQYLVDDLGDLRDDLGMYL